MPEDHSITDAYVRQLYDTEYPGEDIWHTYADENTREFLNSCVQEFGISKNLTFLSIGSGGISLPLNLDYEIQLDICATRLKNIPNSIVADVRCLPFAGSSVDVACMLGEVIGYCDPHQAFAEITRILRPGGYLFFDYSQSSSAEFAFKKGFGRPAIIKELNYCGGKNKIWTYSEAYLKSVLSANNLIVRATRHYHILSTALMRVCEKESVATKLARSTDKVCRNIPLLSRFAGQAILFCQKDF